MRDDSLVHSFGEEEGNAQKRGARRDLRRNVPSFPSARQMMVRFRGFLGDE